MLCLFAEIVSYTETAFKWIEDEAEVRLRLFRIRYSSALSFDLEQYLEGYFKLQGISLMISTFRLFRMIRFQVCLIPTSRPLFVSHRAFAAARAEHRDGHLETVAD